MKKVSVIVPIYNAEKYLNRCIECLLNQEHTNIQIILVNDGSTDNSGNIAKEYRDKYPDKVMYLEKENGGLSDARNYGLANVLGDYIAFLDADDYITDNLYKDLEPCMEENYHMIKYRVIKVDENGNFIEENHSPVFKDRTGEEAFEILYKEDKMTEVAWGYLYRREFWQSNDFKFAKGLYHEDFGLTPLILLKAIRVASVNVKSYNYVLTPNSMVRDNTKAYIRANDLLKHYDNMINVIKEYNVSEKSKDDIKIYYTNSIILATENLEGKEQKQYIKEIKDRKIINNIKARNLKQFIKKIILKINIKWYLKLRKE